MTSLFKTCLKNVEVPQELLDGVHVVRVNASGKMQEAILKLSSDRFTLTISYCSSGGKFSSSFMKPILKKVSSIGSKSDSGNEPEQRVIDIGSINRIQRGQSTLKFELAKKAASYELESNRSFSIIFHGAQTLDLMTIQNDTITSRDELLKVLDKLIQAFSEAKITVGNDVQLLRYIWLDVDKDKSDSINYNELRQILGRINYQQDNLKKEYSKFCGWMKQQTKEGLTFEQCALFLHKMKRDTWKVKPVHKIWEVFGQTMNNGKQRKRVSAETFRKRFLHEKQGETNTSIEDVKKLFLHLNKLELPELTTSFKHDENTKEKYIDIDHFEAYLLSSENDAFDPMREKFDPYCLDKPLSEYWINSSHNTYLTGDQLTSKSSVEAYMNALYKGCRCIELDIWDGEKDGPDQEPVPIIFHGHTRTSKILFRHVIETIKMFLNLNPDSLPIILSLENHCSIPYQQVMAGNMVDILGDNLFIPDENELNNPLPSPQSLVGMVVLKGRRPDLDAEKQDYDDSDSDDETDYTSEQSSRLLQSNVKPKKGKQSTKIAPSLARLTLFHGIRCRSFEQSMQMPPFHMHSFSEAKVRRLCKEHKIQRWLHYNHTHMSRVFPSGARIDSSNYSPIWGWATGCQLVALNFQTTDSQLRLNDGRFRENGSCGYICKPSVLMVDTNITVFPVKLKMRILSGSCFPKPKGEKKGEVIDSYVKVTLHDFNIETGKEVVSTEKTSTVYNNGFFPIWNEEYFKFKVLNPDVAILQFTVWDRDVTSDDFIASSSIPISCLRKGFRSVRLYDANNSRSGAFQFPSLLVEICKKEELQIEM